MKIENLVEKDTVLDNDYLIVDGTDGTKKAKKSTLLSDINSRLSFAHGVQSSISIPGSGTERIEISIEGINSNSVIMELIVNGSTYVFVAAVYKGNNLLAIDLRNFNTADANIALEYTVMI